MAATEAAAVVVAAAAVVAAAPGYLMIQLSKDARKEVGDERGGRRKHEVLEM